MFQVTFSDQALSELRKFSTLKQLEVLAPLTNVTEKQLLAPREPLGTFTREGKEMFRVRSGDHRIYFERLGETLKTTCILHKNTFTDFIYRSKLPIKEEQLAEQSSSFWKYLESLKH